MDPSPQRVSADASAELGDHFAGGDLGSPVTFPGEIYTIPLNLLDAAVGAVGAERFDAAVLSEDRKLAALNADHSSRIGFRNGSPIHFSLLANTSPLGELRELLASVSEQERAEMGWPKSFARNPSFLQQAEDQLERNYHVSRSYCGWLVMNSQFQYEQAQLFSNWRDQIHRQYAGQSVSSEFRDASWAFLDRWILKDFAGPFLPLPLQMSTADLRPEAQRRAESVSGVSLFIPVTFPLPDRQVLREMVEAAMNRLAPPAHLKEWIELVHSANFGKNSLPRFARLFVLQHFWRVLYSRHAKALEDQKEKLWTAFADFLFPGEPRGELEKKAEIVRKDLQSLSQAFGSPQWYLKPLP